MRVSEGEVVHFADGGRSASRVQPLGKSTAEALVSLMEYSSDVDDFSFYDVTDSKRVAIQHQLSNVRVLR